jgi:hypothetical protein
MNGAPSHLPRLLLFVSMLAAVLFEHLACWHSSSVASGASRNTAASQASSLPTTVPDLIRMPGNDGAVMFNIPRDIRDLRLSKNPLAPVDAALSEASFKKLLAAAKPLDPSDPELRNWSYSQWYNGTLVASGGQYSFEIFLGGMGKMVTPTGSFGYFMLDLPSLEGNDMPQPAIRPSATPSTQKD